MFPPQVKNMTIDEIAKLAQTSSATVSLALNNRPGVSAVTRERILQIAAESGYISKKKEAAATKKTIRLVAVSKPDTSNIHNFCTSFFADIINCIQCRCGELGYSMLYFVIPHNDFLTSLKQYEQAQPSMGTLLIGTYLNDKEVDLLQTLDGNVVLLDRNCPLNTLDTVGINNYMGAYKSAVRLIELGHKNIGYVQSSSRVANLAERFQGFRQALSDYRLSLPETSVFHINSYVPGSMELMCQKLQACRELPTAFFCENDYNALCLISSLNRLGYHVPDDFSVIGFDDVPECIITDPQLTTVRVDRRALAYAAVDRLHALIQGGSPAVTQGISLNVELVQRDSAKSLE